jgi:hypothetical protein
MKKRKSFVGAIVLSSAVGFVSGPVWSQEAPGETRQPDPNLTRPGRSEEGSSQGPLKEGLQSYQKTICER